MFNHSHRKRSIKIFANLRLKAVTVSSFEYEIFLARACTLLRGFCLRLQRRIQSGSASSQ